jgi:hypothetical protein
MNRVAPVVVFCLYQSNATVVAEDRVRQHPNVTVPYKDDMADFQPPQAETEDETWTEAKNQRRCDLIDCKYAGGLNLAETIELARLQEQMLRHRQRVAPLPLEDARRLYKELLSGASTPRSPTDS